MIPGLGGMDPRKMKSMLGQLGIKSEELNAKRVIFEFEDKKLIIDSPQTSVMDMSGQKIYSVVGKAREEKGETQIPQEDVEMVASSAGVSEEKALEALKETKGDIAEAIEKLKSQ